MRKLGVLAALVLTTGLLTTTPGTLRAAQPEPLPQKVFDVRVEGRVVDVTFALALNESSSYPLTITAVSGPVEEILYEGSLPEGFYRLQAPLTKITSGALKVVLRTKLTNRDAKGGQTFLRYLTWEGTVQ
jgi:hypothetical protein